MRNGLSIGQAVEHPTASMQAAVQNGGQGGLPEGPQRFGLAAWQLRILSEATACRMTGGGVWVLRRRWWRDLKAIPAEYGAIQEACASFGIPVEWEP